MNDRNRVVLFSITDTVCSKQIHYACGNKAQSLRGDADHPVLTKSTSTVFISLPTSSLISGASYFSTLLYQLGPH